MPATSHTVQIDFNGLAGNPTYAYAHDTVKWFNSYGEGSAAITFTSTEEGPFTEAKSGLGGTITLDNGKGSSEYTISTTTKLGTYSYEVEITAGDGHLSFTGTIHVIGDNTVIVGPTS